jgi:hypothetical protein
MAQRMPWSLCRPSPAHQAWQPAQHGGKGLWEKAVARLAFAAGPPQQAADALLSAMQGLVASTTENLFYPPCIPAYLKASLQLLQPNIALPARLDKFLDHLITHCVVPVAAAEVLTYPATEQTRAIEVVGLHTVRVVLSDIRNTATVYAWSLGVFCAYSRAPLSS